MGCLCACLCVYMSAIACMCTVRVCVFVIVCGCVGVWVCVCQRLQGREKWNEEPRTLLPAGAADCFWSLLINGSSPCCLIPHTDTTDRHTHTDSTERKAAQRI